MKNYRHLLAALSLLTCASLIVPTGTSTAQEGKELVFIFQKQKDPSQIKAAADEVAKFLSEKLSMPVRAQVPGDYSASVQALVSKKADFAYTSSLPFLLAKRDGGAELLLVEQRTDLEGKERTEYDSVFVALKDSPLSSYEDIVAKAKDLRIAFTSPTSTSGYIFPYRRFVQSGLLEPKEDPKSKFKTVTFGGGYTQAVQEVLAGRADVAAVSYYAVEGESAATYLKPEEIEKIKVIARTPGVPTHLVAARGGLSSEVKEKAKAALLALSKERPELLRDVYGAGHFVPAEEDEHLAATVEAVEYIGLPIEKLAK